VTVLIQQLRHELLDQTDEVFDRWLVVLNIAEAAINFISCGGRIIQLPTPTSRDAKQALITLIDACQKATLET